MIREFSVRPVPKNQNGRTVFFALLGAACASVAVSYFVSLYKGIIQLAALILLVAASFVYTRFVGCVYYYETAVDSEGTPIFVVAKAFGRRRTTLCRVDLADVVDISVLKADGLRAYKSEPNVKRYNYTPTLRPSEVHLRKVRSHAERADVFVELSEECCAVLLSNVSVARAMRAEEPEE